MIPRSVLLPSPSLCFCPMLLTEPLLMPNIIKKKSLPLLMPNILSEVMRIGETFEAKDTSST